MGISLNISSLTDTELHYLDQAGGIPITADWSHIISAIESHALSILGAHRRVFLTHLKKVNPALETRIQETLKRLERVIVERQAERVKEYRHKQDEEERAFRKKNDKNSVLSAVRKIVPDLCGLRCANRVFVRRVTTQESIDIALSWLMREGAPYSIALPCLLDMLKKVRGTTVIDINGFPDHETCHLCATEKDRVRIIASLRADAKKTMRGYELIVDTNRRSHK
jgi:hypothetical protein